jgi:putative transposase
MQALTEEPYRSRLIFVPSQDSTEPMGLNRLQRVREPVSRSKGGVQGKVADVICGRSRHAESLNELQAFRVLLATARADGWQEQPFTLEYHQDGKKRRYTPDLLVAWGTHRHVVEIKDDAEADLPENQARFGMIRELLTEHGYHFRLWKKTEICAEPRLTNAGLILRYRSVEVTPMEREKIRRTFSTIPGGVRLQTLRETPGITVQSVLRLVLDSTLHIDWWEPLTLGSRVSFTPIGRQVWPCPMPESSVVLGGTMSLHSLRKGHQIRIGPSELVISHRLTERSWQLQNIATGEWSTFNEDELLDRFANNELSFVVRGERPRLSTERLDVKLQRDLSTYPPELVELARKRLKYLKEIDQRQPISITRSAIEPLIRSVSERIKDIEPPGWRTVCRDYRKWIGSSRDIRAILLRHADRGKRGPRMAPEVKTISDQAIKELYLTAERKRVPEVHLEIVRRLVDANKFRHEDDQLAIPSRSTIYREVARLSPYEVTTARYGKHRAEMEFRISTSGPVTTRALERVVMDHTPADIIIVDDNSMLPLGRPTITTALDEHTRCPMGFYAGFEPPSCLAVMRCLKHAILPKTYLMSQYPAVKNRWECYGVPELVAVDNPPEFHSRHFERACLQIGTDIQYAKVLVPWYKGKLERFQGTLNHDLLHGNPGTTFSNLFERDEYDPSRHAVVLLGTFRAMIHKWIIDVYLQTPHRGIKDTPAHRWHDEMNGLPPPLPRSAGELNVVLGMTAQRAVFHYGIELEGLKYNGLELGELRRRMGPGARVEFTFDPGDLGHINVLDPLKEVYIQVPAVDQAYAQGLSLWQHRVIRRYAQRWLNARTDPVALAQAKAEIRTLVEQDLHRKSSHGRKRQARFMDDHTKATFAERVANPPALPAPSGARVPGIPGAQRRPPEAEQNQLGSPEVPPSTDPVSRRVEAFTDDEDLPVFEAALDLPRSPTSAPPTESVAVMERDND